MFDIWKAVRDLITLNPRRVKNTNFVFQLHCKASVVLLIGFSILVTSRQYIGDPIDCVSSPDIKNIADRYCWIHSSFIRGRKNFEGKWSYEAVEELEIQPGIRPEVEGDIPVYTRYYQWVWAVLFLQAAASYFPLWFWNYLEGGRLDLLAADLNSKVLAFEDSEKVNQHKEGVINYILHNPGQHCFYAFQYIGCEILNLVIVLAQMILTDLFLDGEFHQYGLKVLQFSEAKPYLRRDALARVFPTVTACRIATGGVAFGEVEYELLCVLPINILNEKIYIVLWFWLLGLACVSILNLLYRLITIILPPFRRFMLRHQARKKYRLYNELRLDNYGDWFFLHRLGQNLNPVIFGQLLNDLANRASSCDEDRDKKSSNALLAPIINTIVKDSKA